MPVINLGKVKFTWRGAYDAGTPYNPDDVVSYLANSYICIKAGTGFLPTNATYWDRMAGGVDQSVIDQVSGDAAAAAASATDAAASATAAAASEAGVDADRVAAEAAAAAAALSETNSATSETNSAASATAAAGSATAAATSETNSAANATASSDSAAAAAVSEANAQAAAQQAATASFGYDGVFQPIAEAEYPDVPATDRIITLALTAPYTFTTNELAGETVYDGDTLIYDAEDLLWRIQHTAKVSGIANKGTWGGAIGQQTVNFDSGMPAGFESATAQNWIIVDWADATAGTAKALRNMDIGANGISEFHLLVEADATNTTFRVRYATDCEGSDHLRIFIDGTQELIANGTGAGIEEFSHVLSAGQHEIIFQYRKDGSYDIATDSIYLTEIEYPTMVPADGGYNAGDIVKYNGEDYLCLTDKAITTPDTVDDWLRLSDEPVEGTINDRGVFGAEIIQQIYNFEMDIPALFSNGETEGWYRYAYTNVITGTTQTLRSKTISANAATEWTFDCEASAENNTLRIVYMPSCEGSDLFKVLVDDVEVLSTGSDNRVFKTFTHTMATGTHTIKLRYQKDGSFNIGHDGVLISEIELPMPGVSGGINKGDVIESSAGKHYLALADGLGDPAVDETDWQPFGPTRIQIGGFYPGKPKDGSVICQYVVGKAFTLKTTLPNAQLFVGTAATAQADFDIQKNGVSVGTATVAAAATTGTFSFLADQSFAAGDRFSVVAPATADAGMENISFSFEGDL